jgi:hypothetical protein
MCTALLLAKGLKSQEHDSDIGDKKPDEGHDRLEGQTAHEV